jgi:ribosomal protein S27E
MFLVRCRDCGSRLLQPVRVAGPLDGASIVERVCPECERRDIVVASAEAVARWLRHEETIRARFAELADRLAEVIARETPVAGSHGH